MPQRQPDSLDLKPTNLPMTNVQWDYRFHPFSWPLISCDP